jgi:hypothetical protein
MEFDMSIDGHEAVVAAIAAPWEHVDRCDPGRNERQGSGRRGNDRKLALRKDVNAFREKL